MNSISTITSPRLGVLAGIGMVMMAAALWATVGVAVQMTPGAQRIPELVLAAARTGIAGPMLLAIWMLALGGGRVEFLRLAAGPLVIFALASSVFQICLFRCFAQLGVTAAVFLTVCLPPILGWVWSVLRGQGGLSKQSGFALALAVAGVVLVSLGGQVDAQKGGATGRMALHGLGNGVLASVAFVVMSYAAAALSRDARPILIAGAGLTLSAIILTGLALGSGGFAVVGTFADGAARLPMLLVLYLGLLPTALAYLCYCTGMARCRTPVVGLVASMIEPLLAMLFATVLLGEHVSQPMTVGCILLMAAMVLLWRSEGGRPCPQPSSQQPPATKPSPRVTWSH